MGSPRLKQPPVVADGDTLVVVTTDEADYRIPFTFVEALNEGVLFDRSARAFKEAAHAHQLFEVINRRTEAVMVRELLTGRHELDGTEFIAHVVDGYESPTHSLIKSGFRAGGRVVVRPGDVDASIEHMMEPDAEGVVMLSYVFDPGALRQIATDLHAFLHRDGAMLHGKEFSVHVDLRAMIDVDVIDRYVAEPGVAE